MTATVLLPPVLQFADQNGLPLSGGLLYSYTAGTSTPQVLYTDSDLTVPFPNPIVLDVAGTPGGPVYPGHSAAYKLVLTDADGVQIFEADNIIAAASI